METIKVTYKGNYATQITVGSCPIPLQTDSNAGLTPLDMFVSSYGACMLTVISMMANRRGFSTDGSSVSVNYELDAATHRVTAITAKFHFKGSYTESEQKMIQAAAKACPVGLSISADISKNLEFDF